MWLVNTCGKGYDLCIKWLINTCTYVVYGWRMLVAEVMGCVRWMHVERLWAVVRGHL